MKKITDVKGRQVFDSRGNPTVEAEIILDNGVKATAISPSGASTGAFEAYELRDGENNFLGKSVYKAINNINTICTKNRKLCTMIHFFNSPTALRIVTPPHWYTHAILKNLPK